MSATALRCRNCETELGLEGIGACPRCFAPLEPVYDPDELARTKTQMKGGLFLGLETSDSRMTRLARNMLCFGREIPIDEVCRDVEAVTNDDVIAVAKRLVTGDVVNVTVLGPDAG